MKKAVLLTSILVFSWFGWTLGDRFGIMTAYLMSFAGSLIGVYIGVKVKRNYLE